MASPTKKSNKRKHETEAPTSSDEEGFETSNFSPRKLRKRPSSCRSLARNSNDKDLKDATLTNTESQAPSTSKSGGNQGVSTPNRQELKHSKTAKVTDKSTKISVEDENGTKRNCVSANRKTTTQDVLPGTSCKKKTEAKCVTFKGKKLDKKKAEDLSDGDSDFEEDNWDSQPEEVKNGPSAFRYKKSLRISAGPTPSTSKGKPMQGKKKTCVKASIKVKVKENSASSSSSSKASGKKPSVSTSKRPPAGSKRTGGNGKPKGQDKMGKEMETVGLEEQRYVNLNAEDEFFEVTQRKSNNIVLSLTRNAMGLNNNRKVYTSCHEPYLRTLRSLGLYRTVSPFKRRVTALEWHPTNPTLVAAGSKGGDIILWNFEKVNSDCFIQGRGPGGYVSCLRFSPWNDSHVFTSQLDGTVNCQDFNGKNNRNFLDTKSWSFWYCSVDVNAPHKMVSAGDNVGNVVMMNSEGDKLWQHRLHKSKVTHLEFNTGCDWLMVTASADKTVKLWDIRMVEGRGSALYTLDHDHIINSAYFSPNDHSKLLTTDQHHDLRVYSGPDWGRLDTAIYHPHRFYRHLTPIKASWHPMCDLAVVGRYPDNKSPHHGPGEANTIDVFNTNTGEMVCQLRDPGAPGIKSLNRFSPGGESLASGMGYNILIWQRKEVLQDKQEKLMEKMQTEVAAHLDTTEVARRQRPRPPAGKMAAKIKKKLQDL